jgi:hypothetical protein
MLCPACSTGLLPLTSAACVPPLAAGEHGGDPKSIEFVAGIVDYVSCSPLRVPIARLAAAQAAIKQAQSQGAADHCQD